MMVVLGIDAHKRTHTAAAADPVGRLVAAKTVVATSLGHLRLLQWAGQWPQRVWAVEDCRHVSRRLESELLAAGETVVRVPPKLMAQVRASARTRGKSDPIDALAVARAYLREPDLPLACLEGESRQVKLLVDYREVLVRERTQLENRLRWRLHELFPGYHLRPGSLGRYRVLDQIRGRLEAERGLVADLARREVERIRELTVEINQLETQIGGLIRRIAPTLLALPGCGVLSAAKLVAETAGVGRFKNRDAYAMWNGTAPIPVWSGDHQQHRLNRGGNRQANSAIHRIAITQIRWHPPAAAYIDRRLANHDTKREALRALKRRLSDTIYRALQNDSKPQNNTQPQAA